MTTPRNPGENTEHTARVRQTTSRRATGQAPAGSESTAYETDTKVADNDNTGQEAMIGSDSTNVSSGNVSWGAIFAGVVTFLGIMILLGVGAAAMGMQGSSGVATGIFAVISLAIAFAAAGYVAGALGVRAGIFHGFATWATSLIAAIVLTGWLGASVIGGLGGVLGTVAESAGNAVSVTSDDAQAAGESVNEQDAQMAQDEAKQAADKAAQQAQETLDEVGPQAAAGSWWAFAGMIIGALISSFAGVAGSRSVLNRDEQQVVRPARR